MSPAAQAICLARYYAKKAVKAEVQRAGIRLRHVETREINLKARVYFTAHRAELIAQATAFLSVRNVASKRTLAAREPSKHKAEQQCRTQHQLPKNEHCVAGRTQTIARANILRRQRSISCWKQHAVAVGTAPKTWQLFAWLIGMACGRANW
jgi:hypothetical protein